MADNDSGMAFVSGFLLGGLVGAAIGLLLAPKSGAETRAGIAEHSDEWRHRAEDIASQISHNITPAIENLRHQVAPAVDVVRERMGMEPAPVVAEPAEPDMASPAEPGQEMVSAAAPAEPDMASADGAEQAPKRKRSKRLPPPKRPSSKLARGWNGWPVAGPPVLLNGGIPTGDCGQTYSLAVGSILPQ